MNKWIDWIFCALFLAFAFVQYNDPDSLHWILIYLIVAVVALLHATGRSYQVFNILFIVGLLIYASTYIPASISWVREGMPTIADSMKASSPHIELVREFFGLLISIVIMGFYLVRSKK